MRVSPGIARAFRNNAEEGRQYRLALRGAQQFLGRFLLHEEAAGPTICPMSSHR